MNKFKFEYSIPSRLLSILIASYLLFPNILFLLGWVHIHYSLAISIMLILGAILYCKENSSRHKIFFHPEDLKFILAALIVILLMLEHAGFSGNFEQQPDFLVRIPIYETLVRCDWPLKSTNDHFFVYYHTFWLPPAFLAKLFDHPILFLEIWCITGLLLIYSVLVWKFGAKRALLFFIVIISMGTLCDILKAISEVMNYINQLSDSLFFTDNINFGANFQFLNTWRMLLSTTYNNALPASLCTICILSGFCSHQWSPFLSSLIVASSPLSSIALFVFILYCWVYKKIDIKKLIISSILVTPLLTCVLLYLSSSNSDDYRFFGKTQYTIIMNFGNRK